MRVARVLVVLLAACHAGRPEPSGWLLQPPARGGVDSLTVALPQPVDSNALADPRNESEAIVAAQLRDSAGRRPVVRFAPVADRDPRDLIDAGVDALLTADPAVIDYARTRTGHQVLELPWSATYALLAAAPLPTTDPAAFREELARDVVTGSARGGAAPDWWKDAQDCSVAHGPRQPSLALTGRIVYPSSDRHARDLAERLVALAAGLHVAGLEEDEFRRVLGVGNEFAYVFALPSRARSPCGILRRIGLDPGQVRDMTPLVETRYSLVVRTGRFGVVIDEDGAPRFR